jgi:hypothetical protein
MNGITFPYMLDHILVLKTNVMDTETKERLIEKFRSMANVKEVSIDLEDVDKVLRIVSEELTIEETIKIVAGHGCTCEELK